MERHLQRPVPSSHPGAPSTIRIAPGRPVPVVVGPAIAARRAIAPSVPGRGVGPSPAPVAIARRAAFGLPNYRRNICPHFYMTGPRGTIPAHAPHILKTLARQDPNVSRCQLRGGVHLEQGFVSDVCLSARFNQCVFYEDDLSSR